MRITRRLALCALAVLPALATYAEFSWELTGRVGQADRGEMLESDVVAFSATYYFDPVEEGRGPRALAAFFDPATRVSITAGHDEQTSRAAPPTGTQSEVEIENSDYTVSGQYLLAGANWYVGGHYSRGDVDVPPPPPPVTASSTEEHGYGVVAGRYFGAGRATRLQLALARSKAENDVSIRICIPGCFNGVGTADVTTDDVRLDVLHVRRFRSASYALFGGVSELSRHVVARTVFTGSGGVVPPFPNTTTELDLGTLRSYSVGAELFPLESLGVRLGYMRFDGPTANDDVIDLGASWFFRRNVGLELVLSREDSDAPSFDMERTMLRVIGRL